MGKEEQAMRILSAEQMFTFGRLRLDYIGQQPGPNGKSYILMNDREVNNATYSFEPDVDPNQILHHVFKKRKEFNEAAAFRF